MKIKEKISALWDRYEELSDLRDRGYAVPLSDLAEVKHQIELLQSVEEDDGA